MIEASTLVVILLIEGPGELSAELVLDDVAAAVAWRPTIALLKSEAVSPFARCGADEACLAAELLELRIALGLVVLVNTDVAPGLVSVRAIEATAGTVRARRSGSLGAEGRALIGRLVNEVLDELGHREAARLAIEGDFTAIAIDPPPLGGSAGLFWVEPGRKKISAEGASSVEVEARAGEELHVRLERTHESIAESKWFWIGLAAVVVGAAVTAGVLATRRNDDLCVCLGRPSDACPEC